MGYKISKYNFVFPVKNDNDDSKEKIMYNSRTGALALVDAGKYELYRKFKEQGTMIVDEEFMNNLIAGGYIVSEDLDELDLIKYNLMKMRFSKTTLNMTIVPTADCNFRCIYCYEKDKIKSVTMSEEHQEQLIALVLGEMEGIKKFEVIWYVGEPLLAMDVIEKLSFRFLELCNEKMIEYEASMITNGYLLTPDVVSRLTEIKVKNIQVTLDGDADDHDKRRPFFDGRPTFDKILENLCGLKGRSGISVSVRINADRHNIDRVDNVVKKLKKNSLEQFVYPYLAMVENANNTYNDNSCFRKNEFSLFEYEFVVRNQLDILGHIPRQLGNYCGADYVGSLVINAEGLIYKCWSELGIKDRSVGDLCNGVREKSVLMSYLLYDATEDVECRQCKFLPLCMGGCPYMRRVAPDIRCTKMKYSLEWFIHAISKTFLDQSSQDG